ncbi:sodium:solute symporter family transporter [Candidatus Cardinium hertigii]|uniref:sodium:solute symporter family transporter n=1 Tax=Candidatus Cardinium hertigii TaxID=247481 RepID=UPI003D7D8713
MVVIFLLVTLVTGIYYSHHNKSTTLRTYSIGNKNFSITTLVATVLATAYGGGTLIRSVEQVYSNGLYWIMLMILSGLNLWLVSLMAIRMGPFMNHLSMPETIGKIYGKYARIITALSSICSAIAVISMQINAISMTISSIVPYSTRIITVLTTLILIFYSTLGGIRSVTFTDVLQFITFTVIIPLVAWFMFLKTEKSIFEIIHSLQDQEKFQFNKLFQFNANLISLLFLTLSYLIGYIKEPTMIQRIYMASGPIQAYKVFKISTICNYFIKLFIILISLFVFIQEPHISANKVWNYILIHVSPILNGFIAISLLAMTMSTADSHLNSSAVIVSYDLLEKFLSKKLHPTNQVKIARWSSVIIGLLAMTLTFYCNNLLTLLKISLDFSIPITVAPLFLAVFGFRGSSKTALIGMATGATAIMAWNRYIQPRTGIDGSFLSMLANGLAMMAAHYLLKQPEGTGWVKPDNTFIQIQQENFRKNEERKATIRNYFNNKKVILSKIVPSHITMIYMGFYIFITSFLNHFIDRITNHSFWLIFQVFGSACFAGYPFLHGFSKKVRSIPKWLISLGWIISLLIYLPLNVLWIWSYSVEPNFNLSLSFIHLAVILWVFSIYTGIGIVSTILLVSYPVFIGLSYRVLCSLFPLFILSLFLFIVIICFKVKVHNLTKQNIYIKEQIKIREFTEFKASLYEAALIPWTSLTLSTKHGSILSQVVGKIEESISFLDNHTPLYKEDFQSIINKLYDWVDYFNKRSKAKDHALIQPTKVTLDKLIRKVEVALSQEMDDPPKILVENIKSPNKSLFTDIVCDINQVVYSLVKSVLRIGRIDDSNPSIVKIQLYSTSLQFKQVDSVNESCPVFIDFQSVAIIVRRSSDTDAFFPKVKSCYNEIDFISPQVGKELPLSIDIEKDTISSMVRAHYGYLESYFDHKQPAVLMVLPIDVGDIINKMTIDLPLDSLTSEGIVTPKEEADSMMELMKFHDDVCKSSYEADPIDINTVSGILLLLRKHFRFKRHASGKLFYVRAVGIAKLVVDWVFHSPKVVYAALLYGLVRRTCLPLSYIKEHYNLGVYAFVSNVIKIDKREELNHPSLLYVQNRLEKAIKEEHVQLSVLFIKLAERLYDLRHASGYIHLSEVKHMAQETLAIDVKIAHAYLDAEIGQALEEAAKQALEVCKNREKNKNS